MTLTSRFDPRSSALPDGGAEDILVSNPEAANRKNLLLLRQLRWLAVAGQVLTIMIVDQWLGIPLPLEAMGCVVLFLVGMNAVSLLVAHSRRPVSNTELFVALFMDMAALTVQLYLSGGATNPFVSLYLLQIALGAILLAPWSSWALVGTAAAACVLLTVHFRPLDLHDHGAGQLFGLHIQGMFVCFLLTAGLIVLFMTRINRNLRDRDAYLADLRRQSVEEDHIVRIGLLASGAAHELGTPLATISVLLNDWRRMDIFRRDPELSEEIGEMHRQVDRCKRILTGILMASGQDRGEGTVRTSVRRFMDELVQEWSSHHAPAKIDYINDFTPDEAIVSDVALKQVIFNLLDNAHEASPRWMGVTVERQDGKLVLTVRDAGPGFDKDILAAFGQPYMSSKGRDGGGLGLFLVVNVVRKLGGTVSADNTLRGACVTLSLPLAGMTERRTHGG